MSPPQRPQPLVSEATQRVGPLQRRELERRLLPTTRRDRGLRMGPRPGPVPSLPGQRCQHQVAAGAQARRRLARQGALHRRRAASWGSPAASAHQRVQGLPVVPASLLRDTASRSPSARPSRPTTRAASARQQRELRTGGEGTGHLQHLTRAASLQATLAPGHRLAGPATQQGGGGGPACRNPRAAPWRASPAVSRSSGLGGVVVCHRPPRRNARPSRSSSPSTSRPGPIRCASSLSSSPAGLPPSQARARRAAGEAIELRPGSSTGGAGEAENPTAAATRQQVTHRREPPPGTVQDGLGVGLRQLPARRQHPQGVGTLVEPPGGRGGKGKSREDDGVPAGGGGPGLVPHHVLLVQLANHRFHGRVACRPARPPAGAPGLPPRPTRLREPAAPDDTPRAARPAPSGCASASSRCPASSTPSHPPATSQAGAALDHRLQGGPPLRKQPREQRQECQHQQTLAPTRKALEPPLEAQAIEPPPRETGQAQRSRHVPVCCSLAPRSTRRSG